MESSVFVTVCESGESEFNAKFVTADASGGADARAWKGNRFDCDVGTGSPPRAPASTCLIVGETFRRDEACQKTHSATSWSVSRDALPGPALDCGPYSLRGGAKVPQPEAAARSECQQR